MQVLLILIMRGIPRAFLKAKRRAHQAEHWARQLTPYFVASCSIDVVGQVPIGYSFSRAPICMEEEVVTGFGRGSKQMGVPTANLAPEALFAGPLDGLPLGVYFG